MIYTTPPSVPSDAGYPWAHWSRPLFIWHMMLWWMRVNPRSSICFWAFLPSWLRACPWGRCCPCVKCWASQRSSCCFRWGSSRSSRSSSSSQPSISRRCTHSYNLAVGSLNIILLIYISRWIQGLPIWEVDRFLGLLLNPYIFRYL